MKPNDELVKRAKERQKMNTLRKTLTNNVYNHNQQIYKNIEPLEITHEVRMQNELTADEKRGDHNYINNQFEKKVYKIFNYDNNDSQVFIDLMRSNYNSLSGFNSIYPQLLKTYQDVEYPEPNDVFNTTQTMIDNFLESANPLSGNNNNSTQELTNVVKLIKNYINSNENIKKKDAKDYNELFEAAEYIMDNDFPLINEQKIKDIKKELKNNYTNVIAWFLSDADEKKKMDEFKKFALNIKDITYKIGNGIALEQNKVSNTYNSTSNEPPVDINDPIREKNKDVSYKCPCSGSYKYINRNTHFISQRHIKYIDGLNKEEKPLSVKDRAAKIEKQTKK